MCAAMTQNKKKNRSGHFDIALALFHTGNDLMHWLEDANCYNMDMSEIMCDFSGITVKNKSTWRKKKLH